MGNIKTQNQLDSIVLTKRFRMKNISSAPSTSYHPNPANFEKFKARVEREFPAVVPIYYHSHPRASIWDLLQRKRITGEHILLSTLNQSPSTGDFEEFTSIWSTSHKSTFLIPDLLITKNLQGSFILFFYGPGTDYEEVSNLFPSRGTKLKIEWVIKILEKFFSKIEGFYHKNKLNKLITFLSTGGVLGASIVFSEELLNLVLLSFLELLNYDSLQQVSNPQIITDFSKELRMRIE